MCPSNGESEATPHSSITSFLGCEAERWTRARPGVASTVHHNSIASSPAISTDGRLGAIKKPNGRSRGPFRAGIEAHLSYLDFPYWRRFCCSELGFVIYSTYPNTPLSRYSWGAR